MTDILNIPSPNWMSDPDRNCAIPDQYDTPRSAGVFADQWHPSPIHERAATKLCRSCPVQTACLRYALDNPELEGVWGATTTAQRAALRGEAGAA